MTQITGIGFSNFRVFKKDTFFKLAPISIFTGTNNSGKSSIFKGLQLLKSNSEVKHDLFFSSEIHKLGTFQTAKNHYSTSDIIRFIIEVDSSSLLYLDYEPDGKNNENGVLKQCFVTNGTEIKQEYTEEEVLLKFIININKVHCFFNIKEIIAKEIKKAINVTSQERSFLFDDGFYNRKLKLRDWKGNIISIEKLYKFLSEERNPDINIIAALLRKQIIDKISHRIEETETQSGFGFGDSFEIPFDGVLKNMQIESSQILLVDHMLESTSVKQLLLNTPFYHRYNSLEDMPARGIMDENFIKFCNTEVTWSFSKMIDTISSSAKNIQYVEAIRANPQRLYSNQSQGTSFNELLLNIGQNWNHASKSGGDKSRFVEKWLKRFDIGEKLHINRVKGIATEVSIIRNGTTVDLIDLGYGATQFLPILLKIYLGLEIKPVIYGFNYYNHINGLYEEEERYDGIIYAENGPLLLIEEPESNLHPKLQSLLADFFIDVAKHFIVTLLIETHSEYFIRRLQVLTAAGETKPEDSVIYYLDGNVPNDSDKYVRKININPDGSLTNDFGPGFIDEATNWKMELMRLKNAQVNNLN